MLTCLRVRQAKWRAGLARASVHVFAAVGPVDLVQHDKRVRLAAAGRASRGGALTSGASERPAGPAGLCGPLGPQRTLRHQPRKRRPRTPHRHGCRPHLQRLRLRGLQHRHLWWVGCGGVREAGKDRGGGGVRYTASRPLCGTPPDKPALGPALPRCASPLRHADMSGLC